MTNHCIIRADFSATRTVAGRKVQQLIFEVAIEDADDVLAKLGGFPHPGKSQPCAIALLNEQNNPSEGLSKAKLPESPDAGGSPVIQAEGGSTKKWSDYTRSQQAAILCRDPAFCKYFGALNDFNCNVMLKAHFRIASKRELDNPDNYGRWDEFCALYQLHRQRLP